MIHKLNNIFINIKRIITWIPIIWNDRWWDSCFLLKIMETKLRQDAKNYREKGITVNSNQYAKQMLTAAILCKRLSSPNYTTPWDKGRAESTHRFFEYMEAHEEKIGNLIIHSSAGYVEEPSLKREFKWAMDREEEMQNQDRDLLLKIIQKHLFEWWD